MKKRLFIKNAAVLTVTAILLRTAGMLLRIYLSNTIGAEGMGLYQLILSIYLLASTFATSGLCTAVTRLVTDETVCGSKKSVRRVMRRSIELTFIIGAILTALIFFFADFIAEFWICDMRAVPALKILSFSLVFMGISSCFKGYFMARRKAVMPSSSQIFEQIIRICAVVLLIGHFGSKGIEKACFAILFADTIAETCSCIYLLICYMIDKRRLVTANLQGSKGVAKRIVKISLPIVAGKYLSTGLRTIENLAVPGCLEKYGGSKQAALETFGELKGMALPIIFFPSSFLMSMSTLLMPEISEAKALHDSSAIRSQISRAVEITLQSAILISALFTVLSNNVGILLYNSESVGFLIKVLSPLIPAMYLEAVCDGMLKGLNQQNHTLLFSAADSVIRIICIFTLVPKFGMAGFLGMMIFSNLFTSTLNVRRLMKISGTSFDFVNWLIKPAFFAIISSFVVTISLRPIKMNMILFCVLVILLITALYGIMIIVTKTSAPLCEMICKMKFLRRQKDHAH